jgi:hypothetical protein
VMPSASARLLIVGMRPLTVGPGRHWIVAPSTLERSARSTRLRPHCMRRSACGWTPSSVGRHVRHEGIALRGLCGWDSHDSHDHTRHACPWPRPEARAACVRAQTADPTSSVAGHRSATPDTLEWQPGDPAHRRPGRGAQEAQAAARQEHPDPRQLQAGAMAAARRAAR